MKKNIINSFKYAIQGIGSAIKTERNLKVHIVMVILVTIAGIVLKISLTELIICIILFGSVIVGEIMNTAIERLVDMVVKEKNENAKFVKDVSAGAVLVLAITSAIVGLIIFVPAILRLCKGM